MFALFIFNKSAAQKFVKTSHNNDSLLTAVLNVCDSVQLIDTTIFVEKISPSDYVARILNPEKEKVKKNYNPDSLTISGYAARNASNGNLRGMSTSSQTDLIVNGSAYGVDVEAVIQDYDMPVSADGTTSQISELATMYVSAKKNGVSFLAGDFVAQETTSQFNNFSKKIKGFQVDAQVKGTKKVDSIYLNTAFAIMKGKFQRQRIYVNGCFQGPYYLIDDNNLSVMVLIGSEKVWLDEKLLTRNTDYQIDYNSGTITFSHHCALSSQSRLIVDFQYGEYSRVNYFTNNFVGVKINKNKISIGYLSTFDSKNKADNITDAERVANIEQTLDTANSPTSNEYFTIKTNHNFNKTSQINTEFITSQNCDNRYILHNKNTGFAGGMDYKKSVVFSDSLSKLDFLLNYKFKARGFSAFEFDKNPNFMEQWNINDFYDKNDEQLAQFMIDYNKDTIVKAKYIFNIADISSLFNGISNKMEYFVYKNKFLIETMFDVGRVLFSDSISKYLKINTNANVNFNRFTLGTSVYIRNIYGLQTADSVGFNYIDFDFFVLKNGKLSSLKLTSKNRFLYLDYKNFSFNNNYEKKIILQYDAKFSERLKIFSIGAFQFSQNNSDADSLQQKFGTFTGKTSLTSNFFNRKLVFNLSYETIAGREEKSGFVFLKTSQGQGYYVWNDYNGDGVEDLNEFERAYYQCDADYVKYYVHTGKYITTLTEKSLLSIGWSGVFNYGDNFFKKAINRFNELFVYSQSLKSALNSGGFFFRGDSTVTNNGNFSLTSRFAVTRFLSFQHIYNNVENQNLTIYGTEGGKSFGNKFSVLTDFKTVFLSFNVNKNVNNVFSEFFDTKNYSIESLQYSSEIKIIQGNYENGFEYSNQKRILTDLCKNKINSFGYYFQYSKPQTGNAKLSLSVVNNNYLSNENSVVNYEMLQGLSTGINFVVDFTVCVNLLKYLQLTTYYQMRKPQHSAAINTGNIGIRLIF